MKIDGIRIRNFRTIGQEQTIELHQGLTIVGPNSSGKTNILKAIEMFFTGFENKLGYNIKDDLTFGASGQTSLTVNFSGDRNKLNNDFFELYDDLAAMLETPKDPINTLSLYLTFAKSGKPIYRFFSNEKMKNDLQAQFSRKQISAVNILLEKFVCHYVPSSKSINDLYKHLLLPFIKRAVSRVLDDKILEISASLKEISNHLDSQLASSGLPNIKSSFSIPNDSIEELLSQFEFHLSDPNKTNIDKKGMGIQASAILASFLWITKEEQGLNKKTVWLIEEPESYLHPQLAESCNKILNELHKESLLITTTHSMGFVHQDPQRVVGTSIEENTTKISKYNTYIEATSSIRKSLGIRFSDYYNLGILNVFVEGKTDREIFQWTLEQITPSATGLYSWPLLRSANFLDFSGVSGLEGFMKATYEFIYKERSVVTILDGDQAGDKTRSALQQYLGNKNVSFEANKDFISLHNGFSLEGLFPHDWIFETHNKNPNWFKDFSVDVEGKLQPFSMKTEKNKEQLRSHLKETSEQQADQSWALRFIQVFDGIEKALLLSETRLNKNQ